MKLIFVCFAIFGILATLVYGADKTVCALPKEVGPCRKADAVFYYDKEANKCDEFFYGGCHGNDNRFETKELCEKTCLDAVKQ